MSLILTLLLSVATAIWFSLIICLLINFAVYLISNSDLYDFLSVLVKLILSEFEFVFAKVLLFFLIFIKEGNKLLDPLVFNVFDLQ